MNKPSPATMQRLHRAALEIENSARSAARRPAAMASMRPFSWPFNGADLLRILERNQLAVTDAPVDHQTARIKSLEATLRALADKAYTVNDQVQDTGLYEAVANARTVLATT